MHPSVLQMPGAAIRFLGKCFGHYGFSSSSKMPRWKDAGPHELGGDTLGCFRGENMIGYVRYRLQSDGLSIENLVMHGKLERSELKPLFVAGLSELHKEMVQTGSEKLIFRMINSKPMARRLKRLGATVTSRPTGSPQAEWRREDIEIALEKLQSGLQALPLARGTRKPAIGMSL